MKKFTNNIIEKIREWKEKFGDLDQQEKAVAKKIRPTEDTVIHNLKTLEQKFTELRGVIGLTDEECVLIGHTSIDNDNFIHGLITQGSFTKWLQINFAADDGTEKDFLESVYTSWLECVHLSE